MALDSSAIKIPKPEAIRGDRENARTVQDSFVLGGESPSRVTKHPHGHNGREGLGGVVSDVFLESQLPIKEKPKITPVSLGF